MSALHLTIPDVPRSPNGGKGLFRMHWGARKRYNEYWEWAIRGAAWPWNYSPIEKASVRINQHRVRKLDVDNLYASCKPILDAMVKCKIIAADDPDHCHLIVTQETKSGVYTEIEIEEMR